MATKGLLSERAQIERHVSGWLRELIPEVQILESCADAEVGRIRVDCLVKVKIGDSAKTLIVESKSKGEPKYLFNAIGQLLIAQKRLPTAYLLVLVPSLSKEGKALLRDAGIGYLTLEGDAFIRFKGVLVERSAGPLRNERMSGASSRERTLPFPYSSKASRVVRTLLERPKEQWTVRALAEASKVAFRTALRTIDYLDEKRYVQKQRGAILLANGKGLLDAWAGEYRFETANKLHFCHSLAANFEAMRGSLSSLPESVKDDYRLTMFAGSSLVAAYSRFNTVHLYIRGDLDGWLKRLDLQQVESGANVVLAEPFDDGVFDYPQAKKGVNIVANSQLYLDLFNLHDRAREQAEFLYKERIQRAEPRTLGERIRRARLDRSPNPMKQQGLADFLAVSLELVQDWEADEARPSPEQMEQLAKWLRKPVAYFLTASTKDAQS